MVLEVALLGMEPTGPEPHRKLVEDKICRLGDYTGAGLDILKRLEQLTRQGIGLTKKDSALLAPVDLQILCDCVRIVLRSLMRDLVKLHTGSERLGENFPSFVPLRFFRRVGADGGAWTDEPRFVGASPLPARERRGILSTVSTLV